MLKYIVNEVNQVTDINHDTFRRTAKNIINNHHNIADIKPTSILSKLAGNSQVV